MSDVELDYQYLANRALRAVVRDVLDISAELGAAPGEHHFYIEFLTRADGVGIPDHLLESYPERMTIVLQHQFYDLEVDDEGFAVTLKFKGKPARLTVPFEAVTSFADPSVNFGLRFDDAPLASNSPEQQEDDNDDAPEAAAAPPAKLPTKPAKAAEPEPAKESGGEVVSLDAFRKK